MSKVYKIFRGSSLRIIVLFANLVATFLLLPFIINRLGAEMSGLWLLMSSFTGYYFLLDFGVSQTVSRFIAKYVGRGMKKKINVVVTNSVAIFSIIGFACLLLTTGLLLCLGLFVKGELLGTLRILVGLAALEFIVGLPFRAYQGILRANLDFDILSVFDIAKLIFRSITMLLFLNWGYGIIALSIINFSANLAYLIACNIYIQMKYTYIQLRFSYLNFSKIKELLNYSKYIFLTQLGDMLRYRVDSIVIGSFLGFAPITLYNIAQKIIDYFKEIILTVTGFAVPLFSQYEGKKDYNSMREKFITSVRISSILSFFIGSNLIIFGRDFIRIWMGEEYKGAYILLVVLTFSFTIALSQSVGISLLQSIGKHKIYTYLTFIEGIANLALSLVLVRQYGLIGVAFGTAIPMIITKCIVQPYIVCKYTGLNLKRLIKEIAPLIIYQTTFFAFCYFLVHNLLSLTGLQYFQMGIILTFEAIIFMLSIYVFFLNKTEKGYIYIVSKKLRGEFRA